MIINLLINLILLVFGSLFVFLPEVYLSDIPLIGNELVSALTTMITTWNSFLVTFPYAEVVWDVILFVIIPFEILLLVARFFLGQRLPTNIH